MEKYFNRNVALVSLLCGVGCYALADLFVESVLAAYFALFFMLMVMFVLPIVLYFQEKKYQSFEAGFKGQIQMRINANCYLSTGGRNGYLYSLQDTFCFACFDKKPYLIIRMPLSQIESVLLVQKSKMRFCLRDGRAVDFLSWETQKMFLHIKSHAIGNIFTQVM